MIMKSYQVHTQISQICCDMSAQLQNQRRHPLLGNGSVNSFPWQPNHVTAATDTHATIEEVLETVFSMQSRPTLCTGDLEIHQAAHVMTDGQSVSPSWCRAPSGAHDQILNTVRQLLLCRYRAPPLTRGRVCHLFYSPGLLQFTSVNLLLALASYLYSPGSLSLSPSCTQVRV
jgi:hypothetical protein